MCIRRYASAFIRDECQLLISYSSILALCSIVQQDCLLIALRFITLVIASVTDNSMKAHADVNTIGYERKL